MSIRRMARPTSSHLCVATPSSGTLRFRVARLTPRTWATSVTGVFSPIIFRACFKVAGLNAVGRPPRRPRSRAAANPAKVRSWMSSRERLARAHRTRWGLRQAHRPADRGALHRTAGARSPPAPLPPARCNRRGAAFSTSSSIGSSCWAVEHDPATRLAARPATDRRDTPGRR